MADRAAPACRRGTAIPVLVGHEPGSVGVGQEDVVVLGEEPGGAGVSGSGRGAPVRSNSSRPRCSAERPQPGRSRSTISPMPVSRDHEVGGARRAERTEVAEHDAPDRGRVAARAASHVLSGRQRPPDRAPPQPRGGTWTKGRGGTGRRSERGGFDPGPSAQRRRAARPCADARPSPSERHRAPSTGRGRAGAGHSLDGGRARRRGRAESGGAAPGRHRP